MEISQEDIKRLLDQIAELTSRVQRLEQLLNVSPPENASAGIRNPSPLLPSTQPVPKLPPTGSHRARLAPVREGANLEARIGSHWLNRVGIAAFLIAVSYFLKFAFENNWIGPAARVATGVIAGILVVLWSERFRARGYQIFSYSLKAIGIGVLYLSLWASFQVYHLLPSGVVFLFMVVVTGAACAMALAQQAEVLAWFSIAGGFSTPLLLSTGENREISLFLYLVLLDLGILALAVRKPWGRLLFLGFLGTLILYISWYLEFYDRRQLAPTLVFATIFFAIFALAPLVMASRERAPETSRIALAVLNAVTYFLESYLMIMNISRMAMASCTLLLAASYLLLERIGGAERREGVGQNLRRVHLALALAFITIAIPIRLENYWITLGWLVEAGVLMSIRRLASDVLNWFALGAIVLGIIRLLFFDSFAPAHLIFNMRICLYALAIVLAAVVAHGASKRKDEAARNVGRIAAVTINALALRALSLEVRDYYQEQMALIHAVSPDGGASGAQQVRSVELARDFTYSALWMAYGAMLMAIGFWRASAFVRWQALLLIAATTAKIFVYDTSQLDRIYRILSFAVLGVMLLAISFAYQRDWLRFTSKKTSTAQPQA